MIDELKKTDWKLPKGLLSLPSNCSESSNMEARVRRTGSPTIGTTTMRSGSSLLSEGRRIERQQEQHERQYYRSISHGNGKKNLRGNYFSLESMFLLVCLTASLLILPLILPPLPPPPFLLLLLPIGILALLMLLAFMPASNVRDLTYTST